ncbi:MAG TPA: hypothetical protein HA349_08115 [Methanotrichaceae archaeon]|nr:hypothetical protein [Methanotrichaceae archaeon]
MLVAAFFAVPAMAQCGDGASLNAADGTMALGTFPANMNFDFVKQGNQDAMTFGFAGANPIAKNAFNLEKDQVTGSLFNNGTVEQQASLTGTDAGPDLTKIKDVQGIYDSRVVNLEMIISGDQTAKAFGAGYADNQVNIKTSQSGCCPTGSICPT